MQSEINRFFGRLLPGSQPGQFVDDSTVFKARHKIKPRAFSRLNDLICEAFYQTGQARFWKGLRLLAADGSTLRLPPWPQVAKAFGRQVSAQGTLSCPLARISELYDPLNKLTVAASIGSYWTGERSLLLENQRWLTAGTLLLVDCGFSAFWLFVWLLERECAFCARLALEQWKCAQELVASGATEQIVSLRLPSQESRQQCRHHRLSTRSIPVRLIRVDLPNGEIEVLATSLLDSESYPAELFAQLYFLRWPVEEKFKHDKCRIEMENFSGKSAFTVVQDFYARIFAANLTCLLTHPAQQEIEQRYAHCRYRWQVNMASAVNALKQAFGALFLGRRLLHILGRLHLWFVENVSPIRPGRNYRRKHKRHQRDFYTSYKPCL